MSQPTIEDVLAQLREEGIEPDEDIKIIDSTSYLGTTRTWKENEKVVREMQDMSRRLQVPVVMTRAPHVLQLWKAQEALQALATDYRGKFVAISEQRGTATFPSKDIAEVFMREAKRLITSRNLPFTTNRVGGEVRFNWSKT